MIIPLILGVSSSYSSATIHDPNLKISDFSKDDYTPILSEEKYGLGNITVNDIDFSGLEMGFKNYTKTYPKIDEDFASGNLNMTQINMQFVETTEIAIVDNLDEKLEDKRYIKVKINESLFVEYNNLTVGYLIYHSRLHPAKLLQIFVKNDTEIRELVVEIDYYIDNDDFAVFNYENYFQQSTSSNFTIYFFWEYTILLRNWQIAQIYDDNLIIKDQIQNLTAEFNYFFRVTGRKFDQDISADMINVDNIYIALTVNLPDKGLLNDHILELNGEIVNINDHLDLDKSVITLLADNFNANDSIFSLNFTSSFTLKFVDSVGETWAIDRLVAKTNIRERIYFPNLINGPKHIYLKFASFYEPTIEYNQDPKKLSSSSLFKRKVEFFEGNISLTGKVGTKVEIPYLILGETCPVILKYETNQNLRIVITDNIKMPLVGASVEIFYYGQKFGTYISNDRVQPIPTGTTNEQGEIVLRNVPIGNFTVRVYYNGIFIKESTVSTYNKINYIYTSYPHFPLWILVFGSISGIFLIIGIIFYLKYKKKR
ncbi:MAG: carboxypeptidase-like regulatory domain-containing protein [Promethearchaeota archaeon]